MDKLNWFDFEEAVEFLIQEFSKVWRQKKPTIFHSIRVWSLLFHNGFSIEICIAGLLHDIIEDTNITFEIMEEKYWNYIANLVLASTENDELLKELQKEDIVKRCNDLSEEALIIKMSDVYDNFIFYKRDNNFPEIERCKIFAELIKKYRKKEYKNKFLNLADEIIKF